MQCIAVAKAYQLMQCRELIAVCSERRTEHMSTLCGKVRGSLMLQLVVHILLLLLQALNLL